MSISPIVDKAPLHEIEIAPEVLAAGVEEYGLFDAADPSEWVVPAVYLAMLRAAIASGQVKYVATDPGDAAIA
jgi:hypothetical protein